MLDKKNPRFKSDYLRFKYINRFISGNEILDIGSSEGEIHKLLVKSNPKKIFYSLDLDKNANYKIDLNNPKKINKKFDTVIAGEIIEHLESPIKFIRYCKTLLKKNGRLIITTPNATGIQYIKNPWWCVDYQDYRGHSQTFTIPMLKRICKDEGLKFIQADYINAFWINNPLQYFSLIIKRLRPDLIVVVKN
jgi:cyclopropane fatty-acyl-phospholipid synthase-like methyltransferase